jgi:hypothetical protein
VADINTPAPVARRERIFWVGMVIVLVLLLLAAAVQIGLVVQNSSTTGAIRDATEEAALAGEAQRAIAERTRCTTDTYAPFFRGVALGLLELDERSQDGELTGGVLTPTTRELLEEAERSLATLQRRCPVTAVVNE